MKRFLIALNFLTILPVKIKHSLRDKDLAGSMAYYPLVGAIAGGIVALLYVAAGQAFPHAVCAALVLLGSIAITGALHVDGLLDTIDGIAGGQNKDDILRIMRDSHPGGIGMIGVAAFLIVKFAALSAINPSGIAPALIAAFIMGRWSLVFACHRFSYARTGQGKAKAFIGAVTNAQLAVATASMLILAVLLAGFGRAIALFITAFLITILLGAFLKKKIGGITGDTLGAQNELVEISSLLLMAAWL